MDQCAHSYFEIEQRLARILLAGLAGLAGLVAAGLVAAGLAAAGLAVAELAHTLLTLPIDHMNDHLGFLHN